MSDDLTNTDERLLWVLRILADEFGPLGVAKTVRLMWPVAFEAAARNDSAATYPSEGN